MPIEPKIDAALLPKVCRGRFVVPAEASDENGHVNNVVYVQWMQEFATRHSDALGLTREKYLELGGCWVVRGHRIVYRQPAFPGDEVTVSTWVATMDRFRSLRRYRFVRSTDGQILATAETDWVYVSIATGRPCTIHDEVAAAFVAVPEAEEP